MLDVICRIGRQLGRRFSAMQPLHTLRVIQQHPVLQIHDPLRRGQQLTLPDVGIAERERIVYLHTALNSCVGGQRHRDDKEIFPLARRLLRSCGGKPNQRNWEAMLGRKYVPPVLKKGAFTMDNTVLEMKDDSLIMKIMFKAVAATIARGFGGKKDYENPEFRMLMNSSAGSPLRSMMISGGICGLAGLLLVGGTAHTITTSIAGGRGFTAVMVAWLAKFNPFSMIFTSFLLVFLDRGAQEISTISALNHSFSDILTGIILFFIIGSEFFISYKLNFLKNTRKEQA